MPAPPMPGVKAFAPLIVVAVLALAGCGDDDDSTTTSSDSTTTATTTTGTSSTSAASAEFCSDLSDLESEAQQVSQLNSSDLSASGLKQEASKVDSTVNDLASSGKELAGNLSSDVESAVNTFKSQTASLSSESVSQALVTLGNALGSLQASLKEVGSELSCS